MAASAEPVLFSADLTAVEFRNACGGSQDQDIHGWTQIADHEMARSTVPVKEWPLQTPRALWPAWKHGYLLHCLKDK